ncbi:MAG: protease modulator HflC [Proteobacteria bacterium]|nr:protease modulator HflC [Pseudomonadota bacterium]MDA1357727.1 protease modulator HflC [Pseudomonadota bacterium]
MSGRAKLLLLGVAIVVAVILVLSSTYKVTEYQQAILLQFGEPRQVVNAYGEDEPGLRWKTPFVQNVEYFDKRILDFDAQSEEVILGDQKRLVVDSYLRYRITDPLLFFQTVGSEAIARSRLGAVLNAATRQVLGTVELITVLSGERGNLMLQILEQVNRQSTSFGVDVIDVRIRRADLPVENSQAVYRRMQTERDREAKEFRAQGDEESQRIKSRADKERTILLANAKRESEIVRGQGDALAVKIFADAFDQDEDFFSFYRSMQAYERALGADDTTLVLSPDSEFFRFFGNIYDREAGAELK